MARTPVDPRRNLWPLVGGQSISLFGDYLAFFFALPIFVRDQTGSATQLGLLGLFETVAVLGFGFLAGVLLDRVRLRRALILADIARMLALGLLALAVTLDVGETWMAFAVAFIVGSMGTVFDSGLESYIPSVLNDELLVRANTMLSMGRNLAQTLGFVAGGAVIIATGGVAGAFALDALSYGVSIIGILLLREARPRRPAEKEAIWTSLRLGISTLWNIGPVRWATAAAALANLAFAPLAAVMTLYAEQELGILSESNLGLFFAGFSLIGVVGVSLAPGIVARVGLGRSVVVGGLVFGVGAIGAGLADGAWAVIPFGIAMGGVSLNQVAFVTLRQRLTPPHLLGRVIAASRTIAWGGIPVGLMIGTPIGDAVGLRPLFVGSGILIAVIAVLLVTGPLWRVAPTTPSAAGPDDDLDAPDGHRTGTGPWGRLPDRRGP
ncbi:MAG TPA: MFS transporter [Acidimicrobiia bacterium]|nr:MFS transporter [Acidimicrobiia bacterium]